MARFITVSRITDEQKKLIDGMKARLLTSFGEDTVLIRDLEEMFHDLSRCGNGAQASEITVTIAEMLFPELVGGVTFKVS